MSNTPLIFKGVCHPPAKGTREHPSDLSVGELDASGRGKLNGLPVHVEHDTAAPSVGNVLTSFEGSRGELRVIGQITDASTAEQVRNGRLRGLSLGTDCIQSMDGNVLTRSQKELSVCEEGRRNGTWITHLDNKLVHTVAAFSKSVSDGVSTETYNEAKKLADERAAKLATAEAKLQIYESRERETLKSFQPSMEAMVKELHDEAPTDHKPHFATMLDWTRTASERPNIDTQMQLGCVVHACASKLKRVREDASVQSTTAEQLAASAKELEAANETIGNKERRIGELSDSLKEIQANSEKLQAQLEKAGALSEKFDFSKATSREESPPITNEADIAKTTSNASKGALAAMPAFSPADALTNFAFAHGSSGSSRFMPAISNHALLGAAGSESLHNAIRPM